jgi:hypothetical protein
MLGKSVVGASTVFKQLLCGHPTVIINDTGYRVVMDEGLNVSHFASLRCKKCKKVIWNGGYEREDALGIVEDITGDGKQENKDA